MYIRVDEGYGGVTGYSYSNKNDDIETVEMMHTYVIISDSSLDTSEIYYEDIPNLIKALQAAYDYKMKENK